MKTMSVRDIRQKWPEAERALAEEGEIIVTRDSKPVARILPIGEARPMPQERVDFEALRRWRKRFAEQERAGPTTDEWLAADRADRF